MKWSITWKDWFALLLSPQSRSHCSDNYIMTDSNMFTELLILLQPNLVWWNVIIIYLQGDRLCWELFSQNVLTVFSSSSEYALLWHMVGWPTCVFDLVEHIPYACDSLLVTTLFGPSSSECPSPWPMAASGGQTCSCPLQCVSWAVFSVTRFLHSTGQNSYNVCLKLYLVKVDHASVYGNHQAFYGDLG